MRYKDLFEQLNVPMEIKDSLPPTFVMPQLQNNDYYKQYRHLIALAAARSKQETNQPVSTESAWGENQAVVCYTKADEETLRLANKIMNVRSEPISKTPSHEQPSTNKVSPVRKFVDLKESAHKNGTFVDVALSADSANHIYDWCFANNIHCISPKKMHVTLLHSKQPVPKLAQIDGYELNMPARITQWQKLGDCLVLMLDAKSAHAVHNFCRKHGGTHDYPEYIPHVTVNYEWDTVLPEEYPSFPIKLSKIRVNELDLNWTDKC